MTTLQDKFNKLYSARAKLEAELNNIYGEINNAVDKQDRKVKIERLLVKCKDAFIRVVDKNEELFDLAQKTENPDAACKNLEKWLESVTKKTDEFIAAARGYINSVHDKETAEQYPSHHSKSSSHMTSSKRSSQRKRDLELSRLKREEREKQHEAKLRIARQRLEIEKQMKLRELEIEQLEEDHRKEVAAAALEEIELMTKSSADRSGTGKMSGLFTERSSVKSKKLVQDWVNSSPAGNMADVANEPSLHFSGSIAQSNQAIVQRPSSAQLPNSHFNLNTQGQVEANINLPVHEPSSGTNVTNDAHVANNIMQEQRQPQYTPPSPPINFGMPTQLNAPNTARQLSQATIHFDGLQLDHQFPRRSSMPGQLNLVSPSRSLPLNTLVNAPLAHNPQQAHINLPAPPSPVLNPVLPQFPLIPPAFRFPTPPPQAPPLHATNPVTNNFNLLPHSPPAQFISSANFFVPQLIQPLPPRNRFQPQNFVPISHAPPAPPDPNVWRFPAAVPSNAVPLVRTPANLNTVQPAPLINPHITTSHRSPHEQAAAVPQNYVTSDFMQANPFSSSTGIAPTFVTPIIPPTYGATVPNPLCWGGPPHPTPSAPSLDSADLIKQLAEAITCKKERSTARVEVVTVQW